MEGDQASHAPPCSPGSHPCLNIRLPPSSVASIHHPTPSLAYTRTWIHIKPDMVKIVAIAALACTMFCITWLWPIRPQYRKMIVLKSQSSMDRTDSGLDVPSTLQDIYPMPPPFHIFHHAAVCKLFVRYVHTDHSTFSFKYTKLQAEA
jgi:hypothetical protein